MLPLGHGGSPQYWQMLKVDILGYKKLHTNFSGLAKESCLAIRNYFFLIEITYKQNCCHDFKAKMIITQLRIKMISCSRCYIKAPAL